MECKVEGYYGLEYIDMCPSMVDAPQCDLNGSQRKKLTESGDWSTTKHRFTHAKAEIYREFCSCFAIMYGAIKGGE